jgi:hypothetical protein
MRYTRLEFGRRSLFQLVLVSLGVVFAPNVGSVLSADGAHTAKAAPVGAAAVKVGVEPPRYLFTCESPLPNVGPFNKLEAVWSSPSYMSITSTTATYVGSGNLVLSDGELSIVAVAEGAGMAVTDKPALYLTVLGVCARIANDQLDQRLSALGVPVVKAALALEPDAPQAQLLTAWLEAND